MLHLVKMFEVRSFQTQVGPLQMLEVKLFIIKLYTGIIISIIIVHQKCLRWAYCKMITAGNVETMLDLTSFSQTSVNI